MDRPVRSKQKKNEKETPANGSATMKIQVLHDDRGEILSFSLVKDGIADGLSLVPKKNQSITSSISRSRRARAMAAKRISYDWPKTSENTR